MELELWYAPHSVSGTCFVFVRPEMEWSRMEMPQTNPIMIMGDNSFRHMGDQHTYSFIWL